jgi:hypothetical protein
LFVFRGGLPWQTIALILPQLNNRVLSVHGEESVR